MKKTAYTGSAGTLVCALAFACSACGSSSPSTGGSAPSTSPPVTTTMSTGTLRGTYTPAAGATGARFSSIAFDDATSTYSYTRAGCTGASCSSTGTYTFDGVSDLALSDATSGATEHVSFSARKTAANSGTAAAIRALGSVAPLGGSLLGGDGGALVTDGGSLFASIEQILVALLDGVLMQLDSGSGGAAAAGDDDDDDDDDAGAATAAAAIPSMGDVDAKGAIAELQAQLTSAPLAPYYQDGSRLEGCWANPSGKDLTDIQKALYCSMPLEFRLCNSIPLLATNDSQVASRWQSFQQCEQRVDGIAGDHGEFQYDAKVSATYYWLFLNKQSGLSAADEATLAASVKPASSGRSFTTLLGSIVSGLATEAANSAWNGLQSLVDEAQTAAAAAGVTIG